MSWWKKLMNAAPSPGSGSGRGGALGTPSRLPDAAPPALAQEANRVVSGGGVVGPADGTQAQRAVQTSPSVAD